MQSSVRITTFKTSSCVNKKSIMTSKFFIPHLKCINNVYACFPMREFSSEFVSVTVGFHLVASIQSLKKLFGISSHAIKYSIRHFQKRFHQTVIYYLSSFVPPTVGNNSAYSLRNASEYKYIRSNTQLYYNSFLPSVVCDMNELPHATRNARSISAFKRVLNSTIIGVSLFYLDGKRIGQIYHSRLRMDCSSLIHQLFSKNIIDSPLCICGRPETTKDYLFD